MRKARLHQHKCRPPELLTADFRKIPCIFPCYQGIGDGDWFAVHCVVRHQVRIEPRNSRLLAFALGQ